MLSVIFYTSCVGLIASLSLAAPMLVALLNQDYDITQKLLLSLMLGTFLFATPVLAIVGRERQIPRAGGLILVASVWIITPCVFAIPIYDISELSFVDAIFESVSGLTATGTTTISNINQKSHALIFLRTQTQWMGGALVILTILTVIAPLGIGGMTLTTTTNIIMGRESKMIKVAAEVIMFYIIVTFATFVFFVLTGISPYNAIGLAMASVSTGGFLPFDEEPDVIMGNSGMLIFTIITTLAATNLFWRQMFIKGHWKRILQHRESWCVIAVAIILAVVFVTQIIAVTADGKNQIVTTIIEGMFNAAAIVSTTGVESRTGMFSLVPLPIILFVVLIGGSTFSAAGGLKQYRIGAMITQSWHELDRLIYPNIVRKSKFGSQTYTDEKMLAIWSCITVGIATIVIGTLIISLYGVPFNAALTAALTSFSNAGPVYNSTWEQPNWPSIADFPDTAKITLAIIMTLGRLEVLAVLSLFSMQYWRNR